MGVYELHRNGDCSGSGLDCPLCEAEDIARESADITVRWEGNIVLLTPQTDAGSTWLDENCQTEPWMWLGSSLGVDHHMADAILDGARSDGLEVS